MADLSIPHLTWPVRLDGTGLAQVEQDSLDDIAQCVTVLLSTQVGSRDELPAYGIDDPVGGRHIDLPSVVAAVGEWEPRAVVPDATAVDGDIASLIVGVTQ